MFTSFNIFGQIKLKDVKGEWICDNTDSLYFKIDTIKFYQAQLYNQTVFNNKINKEFGCNRISWIIKKKSLKIVKENMCIEPPTNTSNKKAWNLKLFFKNGHQFIKITHETGLVSLFEIEHYKKKEISKKENDSDEEFEKILILKRMN
jgi:hypothetical protein